MTWVGDSYANGSPLIFVKVGVSQPKAIALATAGRQVPTPVNGSFLIDTGASSTCIDRNVVSKLGLLPTGTQSVRTPSTGVTPVTLDEYEISLQVLDGRAGRSVFSARSMPIISTNLRSQGLDGLLGRDVLAHCVATFDGRAQTYTLDFS